MAKPNPPDTVAAFIRSKPRLGPAELAVAASRQFGRRISAQYVSKIRWRDGARETAKTKKTMVGKRKAPRTLQAHVGLVAASAGADGPAVNVPPMPTDDNPVSWSEWTTHAVRSNPIHVERFVEELALALGRPGKQEQSAASSSADARTALEAVSLELGAERCIAILKNLAQDRRETTRRAAEAWTS